MNRPLRALVAFVVALWIGAADAALAAQLDETWTVSVNGNSVQADADGTFRIANVLDVDLVGPTGAGSPPDGLGDAFVRVVGTRLTPLGLEQAFSQPFQLPIGGTAVFGPGDLEFFAAAPLPVGLSLQLDLPLLEAIGDTSQATVIAVQADGGLLDVTAPEQWTTYSTSNAAVAQVDAGGLVTATGNGLAFITAKNDAVASTALLQVIPSASLTTLVGFVLEPDGSAVASAQVEVAGQFATTVTGFDGSFVLPGVDTSGGALVVSATGSVGGQTATASIGGIEPVPGGLTDTGLLLLTPSTAGRFLYVDASAPAGGPQPTYGYQIGADGSLAPVPGSPFFGDFVQFSLTGAGSSLAASADGAFLFRAGGPGGSIWVHAIAGDGSLVEVAGSPFEPAAAGSLYYAPMKATPSGLLVARSTESSPTGQVIGLRTAQIGPNGSLTDSGYFTALPTAANAGMDLEVNQAGTLLAVSWESGFFEPAGIRTYLIQPDGELVLADVHPSAPDPSAITFAHGDTRLVQVSYGASPFASVGSRAVSGAGLFGPIETSLTVGSLVPGINGAPDGLGAGPGGAELYVPIRLLTCAQPGQGASISTVAHSTSGALSEPVGPIATFGPTAATPVVTSAGDLLFLIEESQTTSCDVEVWIERYALTPGSPPTPLGTTPIYLDPQAFGSAFGVVIVD